MSRDLPKNRVSVKRLPETDEWVVRVYRDGKHYEPADYFTNDKKDALGTAEMMKAGEARGWKKNPNHFDDLRDRRSEADGCYFKGVQCRKKCMQERGLQHNPTLLKYMKNPHLGYSVRDKKTRRWVGSGRALRDAQEIRRDYKGRAFIQKYPHTMPVYPGDRSDERGLWKKALNCHSNFSNFDERAQNSPIRSLNRRHNPELLVVRNPSEFEADQFWQENPMKRRRKYRNGKLTIRMGRRKLSYRQTIKKFGFKKGPKVWKSHPKYHAGQRVTGGCGTGRRRRRKSSTRRRGRKASRRVRSGKRFVRMGGHRRSWKGLVRKYGVKKAAKIWRKGKRRSKK